MSNTEGPASIFAAFDQYERKRAKDAGGGGSKAAKQGKVSDKSGKAVSKYGGRRDRLSAHKINNIVKCRFIKPNADSQRAVTAYVKYVQDRERSPEEKSRTFFSRDKEGFDKKEVSKTMIEERGRYAAMFMIILSPKQNELDHMEYTREIMERWEKETKIVTNWRAVKHANTQYHHVHIEIPGRDVNGRSIRINRGHLEKLRELANEHQYELQDRDYQYEMDLQQEFGFWRDELEYMRLAQEAKDFDREFGRDKVEREKVARELTKPVPFDHILFTKELERLSGTDEKDAAYMRDLRENFPELFPGAKSEDRDAAKGTVAEEVKFLYSLGDRQLDTEHTISDRVPAPEVELEEARDEPDQERDDDGGAEHR